MSKVDETWAPTPGFHEDVPERVYHSHRGSLSHSGAKVLLEAPALFKWQQDHPVHRDVFDLGSAAHAVALGAGMESIYVAPYDDWTKRKGPEGGVKYTTDEKRIAQQDGLSPILPKDWLRVCDMAEKLAKHSLAMQLLSAGKPEVSAYAIDEETGVLRRCRFDYLADDIAVDYKSAISAKPSAFAAAAARNGYHMQHPYYVDIAATLGRRLDFAFIAQEKDPPYLVEVIELDGPAVARGRELNRRALERYRDCTESGYWPSYTTDDTVTTVSLPRWAMWDDQFEEMTV